jgi:hypothetical protein
MADEDDFDTDNVNIAVELNEWFLARQAHQAAKDRQIQREAKEELQRVQAKQEATQRAAEAQWELEAKAAKEAKAAIEAKRQAAREKNLRARSVTTKAEDPRASPDEPLGPKEGGQASGCRTVCDDEVQEVPPIEVGTTDAKGEEESKAGDGDTAGGAQSGTAVPGWNPGQRIYPVSELPRKKRPKPTRKLAAKAAGRARGKVGGSQGGSSSALMVRCLFCAFRPAKYIYIYILDWTEALRQVRILGQAVLAGGRERSLPRMPAPQERLVPGVAHQEEGSC